MHARRTAAALSLLAGLAVVTPAGPASADPKGPTFPVTCGSTTYQVVVPLARGHYVPALVAGRNLVLVPVAFGEFRATVTDADGDVVAQFTAPPDGHKGSGKQRNVRQCSFTITETFTLTEQEAVAEGLPGAGTYTFTGVGDVRLQIRGR